MINHRACDNAFESLDGGLAPDAVLVWSHDHGSTGLLICISQALLVFDRQGTLLIEHPCPTAGTKYVGSGKSRGCPPRTL